MMMRVAVALLALTVLLLCSSCAMAKTFRGLADNNFGRELKPSYLVRSYSVSLEAGYPSSPVNLTSCVTDAIGSLIEEWSGKKYRNENVVASSPPSYCKKGRNWTSANNWTSSFQDRGDEGNRQLLLFVPKCSYYCFTQCIMSCFLCGHQRRQRFLSFDWFLNDGLEQIIKRKLPDMCSEIQNITSVSVTIDTPLSAQSSDSLSSVANWTSAGRNP